MALELENENLTPLEEEEEEEVVVTEEEDVPLQGRRRRIPTSTGNGNGNGIDDTDSSAGSGPEDLSQEHEQEGGIVVKFNNSNGNGNTMAHDDDAAQPQDVDENGGGLEEMSVHFDKETGTESTYGFSGMQYSCAKSSFFEANPENQVSDVREKHLDAQDSLTTVTKPHSSFNLLPSLKDDEVEKTSFKPSDNEIIQIEDIVPVEESGQELPELDIERVLRKQDTHDLFCPNCNSCITRRVILRKRKRKIQDIHHKTKRDKFETIVDTELDANSENFAHNNDHGTIDNTMEGSLTPAANYNDEREPEIFRCLSCFSFFIPTGNSFKLFRIFGDRNDNEEMQNHQQSATNSNRFFSIFTSNKGKMTVEQGDALKAHSEVKFIDQLKSPLLSNDIRPQPESGHPVTSTVSREIVNAVKPAEDAISKLERGEVKFLVPSAAGSLLIEKPHINLHQNYVIPVGDETQPSQDGTASSIQGATLFDQLPQAPILLKTTVTYSEERSNDSVEINKTGDAVQVLSEVKFSQQLNSSLVFNDLQSQHKSGLPVTSIASSAVVNSVKPAEDAILESQEGEIKFLVPSAAGSSLLEKPHIKLDKSYDIAVAVGHETQPGQDGHASSSTQLGNDNKYIAVASTLAPILLKTAVTHAGERSDDAVEMNKTEDDLSLVAEAEPVRATISHSAQNIITSEERQILLESRIQIDVGEQGIEASDNHGWDILKSIVYGGLIESITSLGVVTSAAGAGAATLNVLALGLANLIGGLFIIAHNLWDLKNDHSEGASSQTDEQVRRYNELLGRRQNFKLHTVVAVLSYLIFGLVPPIVYGFSFRKSGDRDLKLAAVAAASLLCVILLAIGKAHVRKPPKSYIKTLLYYVSIAVMASGVSYIAGSLIEKLLDKLGWSDSSMVVTAPAWSSY